MSNPDDDIKKIVNVNKVAKAVKDIGRFALYSNDEENNLLITGHFILNLTAEQFWKVQCKLEAKQIGVWYQIGKNELLESNHVTSDEVKKYFDIVNNSNLQIIGFTDLCLGNIMLYAAHAGYTGIKTSYIEMLDDRPALKQEKIESPVVAADIHIIMPVAQVQSDYLAPLLF